MEAQPEPTHSDADAKSEHADSVDHPPAVEEKSAAAQSKPTVSEDAPVAPAKPASADDDDEQGDDGDESPRVGIALPPRRSSLLSVAFGFGGERKPAAKVEKSVEPIEEPSPIEPEETRAEVSIPPKSEHIETPVEAKAKDEPVTRYMSAAVREAEPEIIAPPVHERVAKAAAFDEKEEAPTAAAEARDDEEPAEAPAAEALPETPVPFVRFSGVKKTYDGVQLVVKHLNLDIAKGEFLTLLGPSGSGKTTTLMMLAGFEQVTSGDILLNGKSLTTMPPHRRGLGFVFQNYALFPHMTVAENLAFPLEVRKIGRGEIRDRVAKALAMVELQGFDKRKPHQLSGGQQQRVAVARALVFDPELVLMDEPLGALDKHLREQMQYELKRLHRELGVTVVYVTHDQGEALTLSDRIAIFHDGAIQQLDTPTNIYDAPANAFVAGFIGENNALPGKIVAIGEKDCTVELIGGAKVRAANGNCDVVGRSGVVCVRPEHLTVSAETTPGGNHVAALIEDFIFHGDHLRVKLSAPGMHEIIVKAPARGAQLPAKGVAVTLSWEPTAARAFVS